jgi:hypothetical protein
MRITGRRDMRISCKMFAIIALLGLWSESERHCAMAQGHPAAASELVQKLQSDNNTDNARKQLLHLGKSDPEVRRYLAAQLPPLIGLGPQSCPPSDIVDVVARWHACPWFNAVELSGKLKIAEAASALAPWINWRSEGPFLPTLEAQLIFHPAAKALAETGDPSIPVLQRVLSSGTSGEHARAVRVLCIIHTPTAKAVLHDDLPRETDPSLQAMIKSALRE